MSPFALDKFERIVVHLAHWDVTLIARSRAPMEKLEAYKRRLGWTFKWVSVGDGDFNRDYGVMLTAEEIARAGFVPQRAHRHSDRRIVLH